MSIDFGQKSSKFDLNNFHPDIASGEAEEWDFSEGVHTSEISVYFKNLEGRLVELIGRHPASVGCVAWLTSVPILKALGQQDSACIVVQKEDFLRPDGAINKEHLRSLYKEIKGGEKCEYGKLGRLSMSADPTIEGVRCVGNHNSDKNPAFPRMHNKFLILGRFDSSNEDDWFSSFVPELVWTGSFNFTYNAGLSLENAVTISNLEVVEAYYSYWQDIAAISEPLNWKSKWVYPEWRIGT